MRCQEKSEQHERMMDLSVEIHGDIRTLEEALARFTATEILDGENKYNCSRLVVLYLLFRKYPIMVVLYSFHWVAFMCTFSLLLFHKLIFRRHQQSLSDVSYVLPDANHMSVRGRN